jgi:hypothetical protein
MHDDPARYWQDLTENYRRMSDGELLELSATPEDLTEVARQVLRDEMKLRRLDQPRQTGVVPRSISVQRTNHDLLAGPLVNSYIVPSNSQDTDDAEDDDQPPGEFTWKTLLCDCESNDHALQIHAALLRHGIESWVRQVSAYSTDVLGPQVYVAADQLEQAQAIAAQPIPQDIIEEWNTVIPEFDLPICPQCHSKDEVVLESTDPVNTWLCEACGSEWADPEPAPDGDTQGRKSSAP